MAFEHPWLDTEELLVEPAESEPEAQKTLDGEQDLKGTHARFRNGAKHLREHVDPRPDRNKQRPRHDFSYMHHDRLTCLCRLVGTQALFHPAYEKIVCKKESAVDECREKVNDMYECKRDETTLLKKSLGLYSIQRQHTIDAHQAYYQ